MLPRPDTGHASGAPWTAPHHVPGEALDGWRPFWDRVDLLQQIGALTPEPWLFDGPALDAEPLLPARPASHASGPALRTPADADELGALWDEIDAAADALLGPLDARATREAAAAAALLPLLLHHQPPTLRLVLRPHPAPDTPAARLAWARRRELVETATAAYRRLAENLREGRYGRMLGAARNRLPPPRQP